MMIFYEYSPGAFDKKNPKSICIKVPSFNNRIFPLCLSFTYRKYVTKQYATRLLI